MLDANSTNSSSSNSNISNIFGIISPGLSAGACVRADTETERAEFLARIKAKTSADFAARDKEIQGKKGRPEAADHKKAKRLADALLRKHAPRVPKKATQTEPDPLDAKEENIVDIDDINIDAIDTDGGARGYDGVDEDADDAGGETDTDEPEPSDIDILISRRESLTRADRWGRPALGFEGGAPLGVSTADICDRGQGRALGAAEMTRADEAREFQKIRQSYPTDGVDYKVLCLLCDPSLSKKQIADKLGRDPRAIRYAAGRIRKQFATGKYHTRRGAGATGVDMTDRQEVASWLAKPLPIAKCGRKKRGTTKTPKKIRIRIPARLKLAPLVAVVAARVPRPYKPRRPRPRWVDPTQVDMFALAA